MQSKLHTEEFDERGPDRRNRRRRRFLDACSSSEWDGCFIVVSLLATEGAAVMVGFVIGVRSVGRSEGFIENWRCCRSKEVERML